MIDRSSQFVHSRARYIGGHVDFVLRWDFNDTTATDVSLTNRTREFCRHVIHRRRGTTMLAAIAESVISVFWRRCIRIQNEFGRIILFRVPFLLRGLQVQKDDRVFRTFIGLCSRDYSPGCEKRFGSLFVNKLLTRILLYLNVWVT